ncbi:MAG: 16S rRNA (cytidine(1402)-2'-O)-methyltransferase [Eubacteriales bacterium]|nr:16S rRNA (cytidine(1402)-2'-O)-methyltransferase [Eubacteriales bacterium]
MDELRTTVDESRAPLTAGLYLVPTPIGNREDITLRALRVLRECAAVYCEDTRRTGALLYALSIKKPLIACHEHNELSRGQEVLARIRGGEVVAYASDAGMPGVSDPGGRLVRLCIDASLPVCVLPGASASLTALVLSGLPAEDACFAGFLPRVGKARRERVAKLGAHHGTVIFYESPLRVADTCAALAAVWGDRPAALCRELTKVYEECVRDTLTALAARYQDAPPKGECVLLVGGKTEEAGADPETLLRSLLSQGVSAKDAAKQTAAVTDMPRNEAYRRAVEMSQKP